MSSNRMLRQQKTPAGGSLQGAVVNPRGTAGAPSVLAAQTEEPTCAATKYDLMEQVVASGNVRHALKRVEQNKGAAGVDGMGIETLRPYLQTHWPTLKEQLLTGTYRPKPVKRVEITKPDGGKRMLGIPTVIDRFIQQALLQVLTPIFDTQFSRHSYGFRPKRSAHQAVKQAQRNISVKDIAG